MSSVLQVLTSQELFPLVAGFQSGIYADVRPLLRVLSHLPSPRSLYYLMIGNYDDFRLEISTFGSIFQPWFQQHGYRGIERLFSCTDSMAFVVELDAAYRGDVNLVDYMEAHGHLDPLVPLVDLAAWTGQLQLIRFLVDERHCGVVTPTTIDWAACNGQLAVVEYFTNVMWAPCTTQAMDGAARCGHLNVVKFLHSARSEGCTTSAMDRAACYGFLNVVEFLHASRTEGCTYRAMDDAAANGHLDIVKFLSTERLEGCSTEAMDGAAFNGHLDIVKYLNEHRTEGCSSDALRGALAFGHHDIALYLKNHVELPPCLWSDDEVEDESWIES
ncbi:unnamed protein product [Aphanomyces euteiches]